MENPGKRSGRDSEEWNTSEGINKEEAPSPPGSRLFPLFGTAIIIAQMSGVESLCFVLSHTGGRGGGRGGIPLWGNDIYIPLGKILQRKKFLIFFGIIFWTKPSSQHKINLAQK